MSGFYEYEAVVHFRHAFDIDEEVHPFVVLTPGKVSWNNKLGLQIHERMTLMVNPPLYEELKAKYPLCERGVFVQVGNGYSIGCGLFDKEEVRYICGIPRLNAIEDPLRNLETKSLEVENFRLLDFPPLEQLRGVRGNLIDDSRYIPGKMSMASLVHGELNFDSFKGHKIWIVYELGHQYHGPWHCFSSGEEAARYREWLASDERCLPDMNSDLNCPFLGKTWINFLAHIACLDVDIPYAVYAQIDNILHKALNKK
jgi:hypothetical protein